MQFYLVTFFLKHPCLLIELFYLHKMILNANFNPFDYKIQLG